jgi:hypothetical protein
MAGEICFHDNKPGNCPQIAELSAALSSSPFFHRFLRTLHLMFNRFVVQNLARARRSSSGECEAFIHVAGSTLADREVFLEGSSADALQ